MRKADISLQQRQELAKPIKVVIVNNYVPDDFYAVKGTSREKYEAEAIERIKSLVREIAEPLFGFSEVDFEVINITEQDAVDRIQKGIADASLAVFSGGPQNIVDTADHHLEEATRLRESLTDILAQFRNGELEKLRLLTICLSHQALGDSLGMRVQENLDGRYQEGPRIVEVDLPSAISPITVYASHRYHVVFEELPHDDRLRVLEFAKRQPEQSSGQAMNDGMLVFGPHGKVNIVSLQFHPEVEPSEQMINLIVNAFRFNKEQVISVTA